MVEDKTEKIGSVENLFEKTKQAKADYLQAKRVLKEEKARINMETVWEDEFPNKSRITEGDKKDFITLAVSDLQEDSDKAEVEWFYWNELWALEKIILEIHSHDNLEDGLDRIKGELENIGCHLELLRGEIGE